MNQSSPSDLTSTVVVKVRPASALQMIVGCGLFIAIGYYNLGQQQPGTPMYSLSEVGMWFFALGIPVGIMQLVGLSSRVILRPDGFSYTRNFVKIGPIRWGDLRNIGIETQAKANPMAKARNYLVMDRVGGASVRVDASQLQMDPERLVEAIRLRIAAFGGKHHDHSSNQGQR